VTRRSDIGSASAHSSATATMPKYALPPQWRNRRAAISKKAELDLEMIMDSELVISTKSSKQSMDAVSSPTTIASTFDFNAMPQMKPLPNALKVTKPLEEMKPLPGAWMVVGKGGRPLKDSVMYDDPVPRKHKKRNRSRKAPSSDDEPNLLADLAEEPSTSSCEQKLHRSLMRREKELGKTRDLKYWAKYHKEKELKIHARDTLIYVLADGGMLEEGTDKELISPEPLKRSRDKGSIRGAKIRRQKRLASAAARCYSIDDMESIETSPYVQEPQLSLKPMVVERRPVQRKDHEEGEQGGTSPFTFVMPVKKERDAWTTVAKKTCTLS